MMASRLADAAREFVSRLQVELEGTQRALSESLAREDADAEKMRSGLGWFDAFRASGNGICSVCKEPVLQARN